MSDKSIFDKRETQFEAEYFNRKNAEQIEALRSVFRKKMDRESIAKSLSLTDAALLDGLVELNLNGELMSAFVLYPLIEVAWADGKLEDAEARAVLAAAEKHGVAQGTKAHAYLQERLQKGPSKDLHAVWMMYAGQLKTTLSSADLDAFRKDIFELCRGVAEASGGVVGHLFSVSGKEKKALEAIEKALTP